MAEVPFQFDAEDVRRGVGDLMFQLWEQKKLIKTLSDRIDALEAPKPEQSEETT